MTATTGAFTAVLTAVCSRATNRVPAGSPLQTWRSRTAGSAMATAGSNCALFEADLPMLAFVRTYTSDALDSASDSEVAGGAACAGAVAVTVDAGVPAEAVI